MEIKLKTYKRAKDKNQIIKRMRIDTQIYLTKRIALKFKMHCANLEGGERKKKKKKNTRDNLSIKTKHALPIEKKDVVRNRMTRQKKFFNLYMMANASLKRRSFSHALEMFFFLMFF